MMINSASNPLAGKLTIKGVSNQAFENNANSPLSGLRISNKNLSDNPTPTDFLAASTDAIATNAATKLAVSGTEQAEKPSISDKFAAEILKRCQKSLPGSSKEENQASANMLADSLVNTANEIKKRFGQEKANEFMSSVLAATDGGVGEQRLAASISEVFQNIAQEVQGDSEGQAKLAGMSDFLNQGLEQIFQDEEAADEAAANGASGGLSLAMNKYFGTASSVDEEKQFGETKGFNSNFERVNMGIQNNAFEVDPETGEHWLNVRSAFRITANGLSGSDTAKDIAAFLRDDIGNENAANYMENLTEGSNFMEAMGTAAGIVAQENGQEAAHKFVSYLNSNIKSAVEGTEDGMKFSGWKLGKDYAAPDTATGNSNPGSKELWMTDGQMENRLEKNGHQGLYTNWLDGKSGVGSGRTLDINQLYQDYLSSGKARPAPVNNPTGNLVDLDV